jgi:hypothetical protein
MSVWIIHLQYMDSEFWWIFDDHAIQFIFQKKITIPSIAQKY